MDNLETALGSISLRSSYVIDNNDLALSFTPQKSDSLSIDLVDFNLGALINNSDLGLATGLIQIEGSISNSGELKLPLIRALFSKFQFNEYSYSNIEIKQASLLDDILKAKLDINDPNINLSYQGEISLGKAQKYIVDMQLDKMNLGALNFTKDNDIYLSSDISFAISGPSLELVSGQINFNGLSYREANKELIVPNFKANFSRSIESDYFQINSSLVNAQINGKINYETVLEDFIDEFSIIITSISIYDPNIKEKAKQSDFTFELITGELDDLLAIFYPGLHIEEGTLISGKYNSKNHGLNAKLISNSISFNEYSMEGIDFQQGI